MSWIRSAEMKSPTPPVTATPAPPLKAMMLAAPAAVPPIVVCDATPTAIPAPPLPSGTRPLAAVPMRLPCDEVARAARDVDPLSHVAGDDVPRAGRRPADGVGVGAVDPDSRSVVTHRGGAGGVVPR